MFTAGDNTTNRKRKRSKRRGSVPWKGRYWFVIAGAVSIDDRCLDPFFLFFSSHLARLSSPSFFFFFLVSGFRGSIDSVRVCACESLRTTTTTTASRDTLCVTEYTHRCCCSFSSPPPTGQKEEEKAHPRRDAPPAPPHFCVCGSEQASASSPWWVSSVRVDWVTRWLSS